MTKTGRVLGTTDYVSPEQAMGQQVDARSDIYSLGIVLFEMLTGEVPFKADNLVGVAMKHVNEKIPDVQKRRRDVSSALAAVVERATEKKPDKRYSDMNAMLADLENALEVEVARAGRSTGEATTVLDSVPRRQRLVPSRRVSIAGILLVLAATAAALVIAALSGGGDKQRDEHERWGQPAARRRRGRAHRGPGLRPRGRRRRASRRGQARDRRDPEHDLADRDLHGRARPLALRQVRRRADRRGGGAGRGPEHHRRDHAGRLVADVYAADSGPPTDLAGWGEPIGSTTNADDQEQIALTPNGAAKYYLIWFTQLAEADDGGRVEVSDVALNGA